MVEVGLEGLKGESFGENCNYNQWKRWSWEIYDNCQFSYRVGIDGETGNSHRF
jgi:hypothetical protein